MKNLWVNCNEGVLKYETKHVSEQEPDNSKDSISREI